MTILQSQNVKVLITTNQEIRLTRALIIIKEAVLVEEAIIKEGVTVEIIRHLADIAKEAEVTEEVHKIMQILIFLRFYQQQM